MAVPDYPTVRMLLLRCVARQGEAPTPKSHDCFTHTLVRLMR